MCTAPKFGVLLTHQSVHVCRIHIHITFLYPGTPYAAVLIVRGFKGDDIGP
jgi:hypothetical protein